MILLEDEGASYAQLIVADEIGPAMFDGGDGYILHMIFVDPPLRGRGIGTRLLRRALNAVPDDVGLVLAPVQREDCPIDVVAWYERHGFVWRRSGHMMERPVTMVR